MSSQETVPGVTVRPFQARDRDAVRRISYETADGGKPGDSISPDRDFIADLLTAYYTDFEPESAFVAVAGGEVAGYLTGCLDTRREIKVLFARVIPRAFARGFLAGALFRADTWRLVWSALKAALACGASRGVDLALFPAHLHVNILEGFRGMKIGPRLMEAFERAAKAAGAPGIHLSVREDNAAARRFFEKSGYTLVGRQPTILVPRGAAPKLYSVIHAKKL